MQTARFLDDHSDWQRISVVNTAIAAQKVLKDQDKSTGGSVQRLCGGSARAGSAGGRDQ